MPCRKGLRAAVADARLFVDQNVEQAAKRVTNVETSYCPRLPRRAIFNLQPFSDDPLMDLVKVVHFDRQVRHGVPDPPSLAMLICGAD